MPVPTWAVGQVLTAADVNSWLAQLSAVKAADTSVTSSTTPINDPDLVIALNANATYFVAGVIFYTGPTSNSIAYTWAVPAGAQGRYQVNVNVANTAQTFTPQWSDPAAGQTSGTGTINSLQIAGTIQTFGSSGNLQFQWAQNASSGTSTTVKIRSALTAQRVS